MLNLWKWLHPWRFASLQEQATVKWAVPNPTKLSIAEFSGTIHLWSPRLLHEFPIQQLEEITQANEQGPQEKKKKKALQKDSLVKCRHSVDPGEKLFCSGKWHLYLNIIFSNRIVFSAWHHWDRKTVYWLFNNVPNGFLLLKSHFTGIAPLREIHRRMLGNQWTNTTQLYHAY